ncbi:hypothetical protein AVEN_146826-1 [Araneus ventricosus]|uniref:Uncharacterized protein n=1 Tax=Araneus ventricosus TaxID=182803 RepID=A0A4Y1ZY83_ARAVE|nr:hypothetical protein AVEN_146826-1 [Araneus ventricosus]
MLRSFFGAIFEEADSDDARFADEEKSRAHSRMAKIKVRFSVVSEGHQIPFTILMEIEITAAQGAQGFLFNTALVITQS